MIGRLRSIALLAIVALASAVAGLTSLPVLDRDEARYAQASTQMLESGDYVRINFQGEARNKKPVGVYWLQAASVRMFSTPEARAIWAYRLPSVLGLLIGVIATYGAGCILVGRKAAFAGAALLAVAVLAGAEAGIAKTDAMLMGVTTVALAALAAMYEGRRRAFGALLWVALAAGVLIKGPVTPMVVGLTIAALVLADRRARWLSPLLWWPGPLLAALIVAPWLYLVEKATGGAFLLDAFSQDIAPKLVTGQETHGAPPGLHLLLAPVLFFPGVLFLVPGVALAVGACRQKSIEALEPDMARLVVGLRFLVAWALPAWIVFEAIPTKLPHYVLPLYPAVALLAGAAWSWLADRRAPAVSQVASVVLFAAVGALCTAALALGPGLIETGAALDRTKAMAAVREAPAALRWAPVAAGAVLLAAPLALWRTPRVLLGAAIALGLALQWSARAVVVPSIDSLWASKRISETLEAYSLHPRLSPNAKPPLVSAGYTEPSLVFLTGTDTVLTDGAGAARYAAQEAGRATLVEERERKAFLDTLHALGAEAVSVSEIQGLNYSRGETVSISIYRTTERARRRKPEQAETAE